MQANPRISVITSSYNQGEFIGRTIDSVLAQNYPNLEHIVVDGMSTDDTPEVLARYDHLHIIREPDRGQADAINKGFRAATGNILCFLNSDDTFLPGALQRVAQEIDPARGRHVVMGRCRFIDEHDRFLGVEHPSAFQSHRRVLEIWKGYCIPQPAVFWTPEVWRRCGPLDEHERLMLDYDLFCRFSREYQFHAIDQVLATYRLHTQSKTSSVSDQQRLEDAIQVGRRYWGSPDSLQFWQILWSYGIFRLNRRGRAVGLLKQGREAWRHAQRLRTVAYIAAGGLLAPDVLANVIILPVIKPRLWNLLQQRGRLRLPRFRQARADAPHTLAWRDFAGLHSDGWAGPTYITTIDVKPEHTQLHLDGEIMLGRLPHPLELNLFLDGQPLGRQRIGRRKDFTLNIALKAIAPGSHELKIVSNTYGVPDNFMGNGDFRPLSFKLRQLTLMNGDKE
jgi:glycosyltransferase involved in cell wall biosynthesis